jgi:hypothetical protein
MSNFYSHSLINHTLHLLSITSIVAVSQAFKDRRFRLEGFKKACFETLRGVQYLISVYLERGKVRKGSQAQKWALTACCGRPGCGVLLKYGDR